MCGVAMMVSIPSSAAARHCAMAAVQSPGPSSTPGRQWWWMSIIVPAKRRWIDSECLGATWPRRLLRDRQFFRLGLAIVGVVLFAEAVGVLAQIEVVEQGAEHRDVALPETVRRALNELACCCPTM